MEDDKNISRLEENVTALQTRLRDTELEMAITRSELKQLHSENDRLKDQVDKSEERFRSGVNRIIWLVGGGLISGLLTFIMKGGLNAG